MERMQTKARARFAFSEYLGRSGKRCTPERLHVLNIVMEQRKPFTVEQLLQLCQQNDGITICRATLFNTIPLLIDAGFMRRIAHHRIVEYESVRPGALCKPRLYMICVNCGKVHKCEAPSLASWAEDVAMRGFTARPESAIVYMNGTCSKCRRKQISTKKINSLNPTNNLQ